MSEKAKPLRMRILTVVVCVAALVLPARAGVSEARPIVAAKVVALPRVDGLHHRYECREAA
jgi:hypothetical protein